MLPSTVILQVFKIIVKLVIAHPALQIVVVVLVPNFSSAHYESHCLNNVYDLELTKAISNKIANTVFIISIL